MASELPITDAEIEQIACEPYFIDIHDILNREIKEEATEPKPFSEYGVENNEDGKFNDFNPDTSQFNVMLRDRVEDSTESKFSPAHFWENSNFDGLAVEVAKHKVNHFNNRVTLKYEDHSECNNASLTNNVENEDDIDMIHEDVKPQLCVEISSRRSENGSYPNSVTDILIKTEIEPKQNFSHELSEDCETWPQQNIEENGTALTLLNHERTDSAEKPFQCKICPKSYSRKKHLTEHERIHTGDKLFQCRICSKLFSQKRRLTEHERTHTGEKPFECKICPKSYSRKTHLTEHERIHTGEKLFQCKICLKSFSRKRHLTEHERTHTGEKPFLCKICAKSYSRKTHLTEHERIHMEGKLFQCIICPKSFSQKRHLMEHERTHTGEKPFQCKICLKSFCRKGVLTKHERTHTD